MVNYILFAERDRLNPVETKAQDPNASSLILV